MNYVYDKAGRLEKIIGPLVRETINEFDKAGNIVTKKTKVNNDTYDVIRYEFDFLSRLHKKSVLVKTSDLDSRYLAGAEFDREFYDRIKATTSYTYYDNGKIKLIKDPLDNKTTYVYDYDGRLAKKINPDQKIGRAHV